MTIDSLEFRVNKRFCILTPFFLLLASIFVVYGRSRRNGYAVNETVQPYQG